MISHESDRTWKKKHSYQFANGLKLILGNNNNAYSGETQVISFSKTI